MNVEFPNFQHRVNAFFGRDDRDQFVRGRDNQLDFLPTFFRREGNEEWLAGFGYAPVRGDRDKGSGEWGQTFDRRLRKEPL